jgi:hypothetical protein
VLAVVGQREEQGAEHSRASWWRGELGFSCPVYIGWLFPDTFYTAHWLVSSISCTQKSYHLFPLALGPPAFFCVFPTVVPSFTFPTAAPLLSFALLERNGRDNPEPSESCTFFYFYHPPFLLSFAFLTRNGRNNPEFSEIFYLPLLTSTPAPFFLLSFWKEMGWATPNFLTVVPSFTYQLPPPPNSILPFEFLERNRRGNPFFI